MQTLAKESMDKRLFEIGNYVLRIRLMLQLFLCKVLLRAQRLGRTSH